MIKIRIHCGEGRLRVIKYFLPDPILAIFKIKFEVLLFILLKTSPHWKVSGHFFCIPKFLDSYTLGMRYLFTIPIVEMFKTIFYLGQCKPFEYRARLRLPHEKLKMYTSTVRIPAFKSLFLVWIFLYTH